MPYQLLNKETVLCISISGRPGNFGTTIHNAAYQACSLNYVYKAFSVTDVAGAMTAVRALGIRGCSVSTPFKESVIQYLDALDGTADTIRAVNTVVNDHGVLKGFNTDVYGAEVALSIVNAQPREVVMLLGAGGVAKAFAFALHKMGFSSVYVANRNPQRAIELTRILPCKTVHWDHRQAVRADVLINATSIGMAPDTEVTPLSEEYVSQLRSVVDVVLSPFESKLIKIAKAKMLVVAEGYRISLYQAAEQFRLYTGVEPPLDRMEAAMMNLLKTQQGSRRE